MRGKKNSYEETHRIINGTLEKKCTKHEKYFPDENPWFPCNNKYFYKNRCNKEDGLFPNCIKCEIKRADIWQKENPESKRINKQKYDAKDERVRIRKNYARKLRETDYYQQYYKDNPEQFKKYNENHKNHDITFEEWVACKDYFDNTCAYCGLPIEKHNGKYGGTIKRRDFQKDHLFNNGNDTISNCVPSCKRCNTSKWKHEFELWYKKQKFYSKEKYEKIMKWINEDCNKIAVLNERELI